MSRIKVFIDGDVFDNTPQGTSAYLHGLYNEILRGTDRFEFYIGVHSEKIFDYYPDLRGQCRLLTFFFRNKILRFLFEIPFLFFKYNFDYAHFQYVSPFFCFNTKIIVTLHDVLFMRFKSDYPFFYRFSRSIFFKWAARKSDLLLTVSEYSRKEISHFFHIPESKIFVIPNGVESRFIDKSVATKVIYDKFGVSNFILNVSRFEPRKNQLAIVMAYVNQSLHKQGISLVFIGAKTLDYPDFFDYIDALDKSILKNIYFFSGLSKSDLDNFYAAAKVFIYPSLSEGFGIPPIEAAVQRTPVVCSNTTAMEDFDFFSDNHIDPNDSSSLEVALKRVIQGENYNVDYVKSVVEEKYSWQTSQRKFLELIKRN